MLLYPVKIFESSVPFFVLVPIALNTVLKMAVAFCFLVEYEETLFFMLEQFRWKPQYQRIFVSAVGVHTPPAENSSMSQ